MQTGCKKCEKSKCTEGLDGYYLSNNECKKCKSPCATRSSSFRCTLCIDGHLLSGLGNCNARCSGNCLTCQSNMNQCTSCKNGFMVVELVISMKMRFVQVYLNGEKCVQCDSSCKSCYGTATSCSTCADGYYFTSMNFEPGQYYTGLCCLCNGTGHENCQLCIENCNDDDKFTCSPNPICTRCSDGFILMINGYKLIGAVCINVSDNYGFTGENAVFSGCYSSNGGGGGICIYNTLKDSSYEIYLKKLTFKSCKAHFGGAVYIYSRSEKSYVKIEDCNFVSNELSGKSSGDGLSGGSAIYLTTSYGHISNCVFSENKGNGGAVKITDDLSVLPESLKLLQNVNDSKASILISDCVFEINQNSDCSLFYAKEKGFTKINVEHCTFNGNLANGAHYID
ncbi:hypothetical protein M9Y10_016938 [Tritrichomonas musculus]|uniref:Right handed beta helix domain-containing protein n=1 Tax=Tritrichomonas musculus TaxID=1915356 RepID=A0ABR2HXX5_9EUKA